LLRGRDIKRYSYDFADLYIITTFPSLKIDIELYPAVKEHLLSFGYDRLKQTGDKGSRKKTNNKWFETQDSISYWDDFSIQKIIYPNMTKFLPFVYDLDGVYVNQKCFIITGENIAYLTAFFNSKIFKCCFKDNFPELQGGTRELSKIFF
ncbi:TaqI-like C-terminal specificity domain-containing protein, partial [Empedobacter falsenii]